MRQGFPASKSVIPFSPRVMSTERTRSAFKMRRPRLRMASSPSVGIRRMPPQASRVLGVMQSTPR